MMTRDGARLGEPELLKLLLRPSMLSIVALTAVILAAPGGRVGVLPMLGSEGVGGVETVMDGPSFCCWAETIVCVVTADPAGDCSTNEGSSTSSSTSFELTLRYLNARASSSPQAKPPSSSGFSGRAERFGASSSVCSQPTGGEPGGEMRKFRLSAGTARRVECSDARGRMREGPKKARRGCDLHGEVEV